MASVLSKPYFHDEAAAYAKLESIVWPHGPICPHCGGTERIGKLRGSATRMGVHKCYACRKQFRVTVNTVFESSHVKLHEWLQATFLMASSKKGVSSNQMARALGCTVKTGWFVTHRLREAMASRVGLPQMGGPGCVVEIDETFIGRKKGMPKLRGYAHKHAVLSLVERSLLGAKVMSFHVTGTASADLLPIIKAHVHSGTHVMTDEAGQYAHLGKYFTEHDFVCHSAGEYGRGIIHTYTVEGFYSVFKRGMIGVYQHCGERHLSRYVAEFDFRYNHRVRFGINDEERTDRILRGIVGKRLMYRDSSVASV
ncbi:MAG: IS1595 family transposase [Candidatus Eremiobacteraeota bacterium]|nr:IS1595 family transposase [Candidatus Eremiobacteraeota bacterium]